MTTFSVIGAGNLGASLIHSLQGSEYSFRYIYKRSKFPQFSSHIESDLGKVVSGSDVIFISVQESRIGEVAGEIAKEKDISGKIFFHTSNSLTSEELLPLKAHGGIIASFSPLQTLPGYLKNKDVFKGVNFLSEGDPDAVALADRISVYLQAKNIHIDPETKIFFHIGAVISSNFLNSLLRFADIQIKKGGEYNYEVLLPLVKQTLRNIESKGLERALSGPSMRKESGIIEKHLEVLGDSEKELYKLLNEFIST